MRILMVFAGYFVGFSIVFILSDSTRVYVPFPIMCICFIHGYLFKSSES